LKKLDLPRKIAVVGANGFVGSRLVEMFHLGRVAEVVPVVRSVPSLARISRFTLDWRLADATDVDSLVKGFAGCDAVIHCVVGDPRAIEAAAKTLVPAAARAGVRRVVYLSTASVHGQNPEPGTNESSPLHDRHEISYNNAKVNAERTLFDALKDTSVELVALRPSIVFGPRDRWISTLAKELSAGTAWLVDEGRGQCNTIYVDNLVHAVRCSLAAASAAMGRAYLVGDAEEIVWSDLYERVARSGGIDPATIHRIQAPVFPPPNWIAKLDGLRSSPTAQKAIALMPTRLKSAVKGLIKGFNPPPRPNGWTWPKVAGPRPTKEIVRLQQCTWRLPFAEAAHHLGYRPVVSLKTGLERTLAFLNWTQR
jgi:2-alkyl-3-oxoalkanoate reductase